MTAEVIVNKEETKRERKVYKQAPANAPVYGLGMLGAWFYYISTATSFSMGLLGLLKGIFWPAMLVYELLKYLGM